MNKKTIAVRFVSLAIAASVCSILVAQTGIKVEESTGSTTRQATGQVIDIQLGTTPETPKIVIESPAVKPDAPSDRINLTPAEFHSNSSQAADISTTGTVPKQEAESLPAGIPVPTDTQSDSQQDAVTSKSVESVSTPEPAPVNEPVIEKPEAVEYLPPADLGTEPTLTRGGNQIPQRPEALASAPLEVTVPDVFETTLTNGIRFYHYPSHDLPRIQVRLLIEAGSNSEASAQVGLAELTQRTLRAGGAAGKSGDDIDRQLEQIGSDLDLTTEREAVSGSMFALVERADESMRLLADILTKPEFDEKKLQQQKMIMLEDLRRQNDEPDAISRREFRKIIYGHDHPLARTPTSATLSSFGRDDVRALYDARYRPSTLWLGISGDISQEDARKLVEKHFGGWQRPEAESQPALTFDVDKDSSAGIYITRKATAQSQIRLGHLGIPRMSPLAPAVNVMNSIYGTGGFSSRLMNEVRTSKGYVYGVGGGIMSDDPAGLFVAAAASKSGTTVAAINEMVSVTKSLTQNPPGPAELETARRDVFFTFVNQFATASGTLSTHMLYDYRGYPEDYLKTFPDKIQAVTVENVKSVAEELLRLDRVKIYVIGNENELDAPLSTFGDVVEWQVQEFK